MTRKTIQSLLKIRRASQYPNGPGGFHFLNGPKVAKSYPRQRISSRLAISNNVRNGQRYLVTSGRVKIARPKPLFLRVTMGAMTLAGTGFFSAVPRTKQKLSDSHELGTTKDETCQFEWTT